MLGQTVYKLSCDPLALEKCFLVADVLADRHGEPYLEYGLVGLADQRNPFHVVTTLILPGQEITSASVYQSGLDVFRLREYVFELRKRKNFRPPRPTENKTVITFIYAACGQEKM